MAPEHRTPGAPATDGPQLTGLPPAVSASTVLLVLGSFPGAASLAAGQYYAHPRNHFWPILQAIFASSQREMVFSCYEKRIDWMLGHGVGLWDVYARCERVGSLDTAIRHATVNDFSALRTRCPGLRAVAHNGGESFRHAHRATAALGLPVHRLPSTSPANASWSFERKLAAWRAVCELYGLI
jgi:hypoxanthine-DNA glycosylase